MTLEELKSLHWATLKKMVEDAGGTYEDKDTSIEFLLGKVVEKPVDSMPTVKLDSTVLVGSNKKSSLTLDKSKPFGEIFGDVEGFPTARYSQGEHLFNSHGEKL